MRLFKKSVSQSKTLVKFKLNKNEQLATRASKFSKNPISIKSHNKYFNKNKQYFLQNLKKANDILQFKNDHNPILPKFFFRQLNSAPFPFYSHLYCVDPQSAFVKNHIFHNAYVERIKDPLKNCHKLLPKLLPILNDISKQALESTTGLGESYIAEQLKITRELILIRNKTNLSIDYFLRLDVYEHLSHAPCSIAMYKVFRAPHLGLVHHITLQILADELKQRHTANNSNPSTVLISRTDNPKIYQMRFKISDNIFPNLYQVDARINNSFKMIISDYIKNHNFEKLDMLFSHQLISTPDKCSNQNLELLIKLLPNVRLNLTALKHCADIPIINELKQMVKYHYSYSVPKQYALIMQDVIRYSYNSSLPHDYTIFRAADDTPYLNKYNQELAHDGVINDLFHYFLPENRWDLLLFCSEINYIKILEKLNFSQIQIDSLDNKNSRRYNK